VLPLTGQKLLRVGRAVSDRPHLRSRDTFARTALFPANAGGGLHSLVAPEPNHDFE